MNLRTASLSSTAGRWILVATILASGMAFLDSSVVNVALPTLQRELHLSFGGLQWVVNSYLLTLSAFMLSAGALGDRFGRRRVFLIGIAIFTLGSLLSALSRSETALIASRAFQGLGGAVMIPGSLSLIRASIDPSQQGRAIGLWAGYAGGLAALGPLAGGWLVEHAGWPSIFLINLPLGLLAWALTVRFIAEHPNDQQPSIDWWGTLTIIAGLGGVSYGLIQGPTASWTPLTIGIFLVGLVSLATFVAVERRTKNPMVPFQLFNRSTVVGANVATLFIYGALAVVLLFVVLDLQQIRGFSPTQAGLGLLPTILLITFLTGPFGARADKFGARRPMTVGALTVSAGIAWLAFGASSVSYWIGVFPGLFLFGLGMAILIAPLTQSALAIDDYYAGTASGVNNAIARVAGLIAIAALGAMALGSFRASLATSLTTYAIQGDLRAEILDRSNQLAGLELPDGVPSTQSGAIQAAIRQSFTTSERTVYLLAALMTLTAAAVSWRLIRDGDA